jgi:hypothetical protein
MKMPMFRLYSAMAVVAAAALSPTAALADESYPDYIVNDGDGTCYEVSCGPYGCAIVDIFYCPLEVSGN